MSVKEAQFCTKVMKDLNEFRKEGTLCDITLNIRGVRMPAHRNVLAASSLYFRALFSSDMKEREESAVTIEELEPKVMEEILSYMYSGAVELNEINAFDLAVAADYMILSNLKQLCCDFLIKCLNSEICLAALAIAERYNFQDLRDAAQLHVLNNFGHVSRTDEFLNLSVEQLLAVMSSDNLVAREDEVYESLVRWTKHSLDTRKQHFATLFPHIRLIYLARYYLLNEVEVESLVQENLDCKHSVEAAKEFFSSSQLTKGVNVSVCQPRSCQNGILITGGWQEDSTITASTKLFIPTFNKCFDLCPMVAPRKNHGISVCESMLYVVGGSSNEDRALRSVEFYDPKSDSWASARSLATEVSGVSVATLAGYLYAVGGCDGNGKPVAIVQRYSPRLNKWQYITPMNSSRMRHSVVVSTYLYSFGGYGSDDYRPLNSAEMYDPGSNSWFNITPMFQKRSDACAAGIGHKIYIMGGEHILEYPIKLDMCEIYEPATNTWSSMTPLQIPRSHAGVAVIGNQIYVLGGINLESREIRDVECYDIEQKEWKVVWQLPVGVEGLASCMITVPGELMVELAQKFKGCAS